MLLAIAAAAVWFLMEPELPMAPDVQTRETVSSRSSEISGALSDAELNELSADSAPQQQVVNGWVARDLLAIIAEQQNEALTRDEVPPPVAPAQVIDHRVPALVGLLVLGMALTMVTSGAVTTPRTGRGDPGPGLAAGAPLPGGT